jgi:hypothetical protein
MELARMVAARSLVVLALFAVLVASGVSTSGGASSPVGAEAPPDKRVMLVADSVGLGVRYDLDDQFPDDWDVSVIGTKSVSIGQLERDFVRPNLDRLGDHVVVAGGYNFPYGGGLATSIDSMVDTLTGAGVEHVYWVTLREVREEIVSASAWRRIQPFYWYFPVVNAELDRAVGRHPELTLIDWAVAADRPGVTTDAIHLNQTGVELYGSLIRRAVGDSTLRPPNGGITLVNVASPEEVASGDVVAVALNLTSVRGRDIGYLSAYPCDEEPQNTSNLNHRRDEVVAAAAIVRVGASGDICVDNRQAGHVVVDVFGRFGDDADLLDISSVRALDTRADRHLLTATEHRVAVVEPVASEGIDVEQTVALNLTVVNPLQTGYATVHECFDGPGETSNVNFDRAVTTPNLVVARTNAAGEVCVTTTASAHLIVDVLAVFGSESTVTASARSRLVDTRGADTPPDGGTVAIDVPAAADGTLDGGVIGNLTIVGASAVGYATAYPCAAGRPDTSNINFRAGATIANAVVVEPDADGRICVFTSVSAGVVFDLMATTGSGFEGIIPTRASDSRL